MSIKISNLRILIGKVVSYGKVTMLIACTVNIQLFQYDVLVKEPSSI